MIKYFVTLLPFLMLLTSCTSYDDTNRTPSVEGNITDNAKWYEDESSDVLRVDVAIATPNDFDCAPYTDPTAPLRPCTLEDIDGDTDANDDYEPELHVKIGTSSYTPAYATFEQKGKSTRHASQKSYRVKLDSKDLLQYKERTWQLNKHPNDDSRVRNKLSFDLFRDIPNFTSSKTRFVNLYINDVDYGLFTHVEKTDKYFLRNRGWNEDDYIYKAQNFDFRYTDALEIDEKGKPLHPEEFEEIIEPENGKDYSKLIEMLQAINKTRTDAEFTEEFNKYFDRNNYITWMAVNIVMANKDTVSQNFFLYNPLFTEKFYFMPWDYDGIGRETYKYAKWELGIGTWWGVPLHRRFLKIAQNRLDLDKMVDTLREKYITPQKIQGLLDQYKKVVEPFILSAPDDYLGYDEWKTVFDIQPQQVDINIKNYKDQIGSPMPFWQSSSYENGILKLKWEESVDFEGDKIVYDLYCADNPDFNNSIVSVRGIDESTKDVNVSEWGEFTYEKSVDLTLGKHLFMKVVAREKENSAHWQIAFDKEVVIDDVHYFGLLEFVVGRND